MHLQRKLNAKDTCLLSWWASQAGLQGLVEQLAFRPDAATSSYQRHLDHVLMLDDEGNELYTLDMVGHHKHDASRTVHKIKVRPPHEAVNAEVAEHPEVLTDLASSVAAGEWAEAYHKHPLVSSGGPPP
eukprot:1305465-Alexandrium_andersonii.AAC.1